MLHILFVPGMFGSTLEALYRVHVLKEGAEMLTPVRHGAMHGYSKMFHPTVSFTPDEVPEGTRVTTPIYPRATQSLNEILAENRDFFKNGKLIVIRAETLEDCELNLIYQYYKLVVGGHMSGQGVIFGGFRNYKAWNDQYESWLDMKPWEARECLSIYYPDWISSWTQDFEWDGPTLILRNTDILRDLKGKFCEVAEYTGNKVSPESLDPFCEIWAREQQYAVELLALTDTIVAAVINDDDLTWQATDIVTEAIVQRKLRSAGYEIDCFELDTFPTDTKTLAKVLRRV